MVWCVQWGKTTTWGTYQTRKSSATALRSGHCCTSADSAVPELLDFSRYVLDVPARYGLSQCSAMPAWFGQVLNPSQVEAGKELMPS
jgi:hypothetical protein